MISRSVWDYTRKLVSSVHMLQEMVGGEGEEEEEEVGGQQEKEQTRKRPYIEIEYETELVPPVKLKTT